MSRLSRRGQESRARSHDRLTQWESAFSPLGRPFREQRLILSGRFLVWDGPSRFLGRETLAKPETEPSITDDRSHWQRKLAPSSEALSEMRPKPSSATRQVSESAETTAGSAPGPAPCAPSPGSACVTGPASFGSGYPRASCRGASSTRARRSGRSPSLSASPRLPAKRVLCLRSGDSLAADATRPPAYRHHRRPPSRLAGGSS